MLGCIVSNNLNTGEIRGRKLLCIHTPNSPHSPTFAKTQYGSSEWVPELRTQAGAMPDNSESRAVTLMLKITEQVLAGREEEQALKSRNAPVLRALSESVLGAQTGSGSEVHSCRNCSRGVQGASLSMQPMIRKLCHLRTKWDQLSSDYC